MIPEIGHFSLLLALCFAVLQSFVPWMGAHTHRIEWMRSAYALTLGQFVFVLIAMICLAISFITHDFSVQYVAANSNTSLDPIYRFCAIWGAHEGSMLLWLFFLSSWMAGLLFSWNTYPLSFISRALAILGIISVGFLIFLIGTSDPFERIFFQIPVEGRDLNPLLQDPGLVSHPPMLYAGYVGFAIPFAFALAGLMSVNMEKTWVSFSRPYTLLAWGFLTIGIVLGSWWAYRQLGWGGWWFWDPVENASFMPWLSGVILIHSMMVIEKRQMFMAWGILMAIVTFALSLLGTFIVRSGILISVHAFAVDPRRGLFILFFLCFVVGGALILYAYHAKRWVGGEKIHFFSRDTFLLLNNIFLFSALMTVLIGTLYPLIIQVLGIGQISVGPPYFNKTFGFLMIPMLFLMGWAPLVHWKKDSMVRLKKRLGWMLLASGMTGFWVPYWITGEAPWLVVMAVALFTWIMISLFQMRFVGVRWLGIFLSHGGMSICLLGIILSTVYTKTADVRLSPQDQFELAGYHFTLQGVKVVNHLNYDAQEAQVEVYAAAGRLLNTLKPQIRVYKIQTMALPKAAIDANWLRDIYVTLSEPVGQDAWGFRISFKPFVRWIWVGGLLIALGGIVSALRIWVNRRRFS